MRYARVARFALASGALVAAGGSMALAAPGSSPAKSCADYAIYSAVATATGVQAEQTTGGLSLVGSVDGSLPAAQAVSDSVRGSHGWAGAPYSSTAADNVGLAGADANQIPTFAISSYPSKPQAANSTPAWTVKSSSNELSTTAEAAAGGPDTGQASMGRMDALATASCGSDASVQAVADSTADLVDIEGVLRIASIHAHATATVDASGNRRLDGSMDIEGATVLGQPVGITDKGLEVGSTVAPLPQNPLAKALADAGITLVYVAAVKDSKTGEMFSPGLEIDVSRSVQGVGSGPLSTSYTFGRAYARAGTSPGDQPTTSATGAVKPPTSVARQPGTTAAPQAELPAASSQGATTSGAAPSLAPTTAPPPAGTALVAEQIANWSLLPMYLALGGGTLLLLFGWFGLEKVAVVFGWR